VARWVDSAYEASARYLEEHHCGRQRPAGASRSRSA